MINTSHSLFVQSQEWARRGVRYDAWAASRWAGRADDPFSHSYPRYVQRAEGASVWDVDGNQYTDFVIGYGSAILGHAHPEVTAAVVDELRRGTCISPMRSPRQVELTELLVSVIPDAQMAHLLKTGSDATSGAVRLARIHTHRTKVVHWGYQGWHDWAVPRPAGIPQSVAAERLTFAYNNIDSLRDVFATYPDEIACVIMMPFEVEPPRPYFLEEVREITHEHGALLIFDEMRTGFRMALGGAQEYFGVSSDLSTFSKAMANGYPISAIVGRADIMKGLSETHISSTSYANPAEMAAAITTISILRDTDALARVWHIGEVLQSRLRQLISEYRVPAEMIAYPPFPAIRFYRDNSPAANLNTTFFQENVMRGVLFRPNLQWVLSAAHVDADVDAAVMACREAFETVFHRSPGTSERRTI